MEGTDRLDDAFQQGAEPMESYLETERTLTEQLAQEEELELVAVLGYD